MKQPNNGKPIDLMFFKVNSSRFTPGDHRSKKAGSKGGKVSGIKKGFSAMTEERAKAIRAKAQETRKRNAQSK